MSLVWLLLHLFGFALWIGGGFAAMFAGIAARKESRAGQASVARVQAELHRKVIAPGALLVVLSGLILTFRLMGAMSTTPMSGWLMLMQGAGLLGALIVLAGSLPAASRLTRLDPEGPHAAAFDDLRNRQRLMASVAGVLALLALVGGVANRLGF